MPAGHYYYCFSFFFHKKSAIIVITYGKKKIEFDMKMKL